MFLYFPACEHHHIYTISPYATVQDYLMEVDGKEFPGAGNRRVMNAIDTTEENIRLIEETCSSVQNVVIDVAPCGRCPGTSASHRSGFVRA